MAKPGKGATPQIKFGRYNALTKLGQGAMATVYLAEDPSLNRMVAIKVIHSHLASNSSLLDRFTVEAKTAAVLRNPNIVEIFDYGMEDDTQYLVMEYIDGPNLQFVLNLLQGQPMAPEVAAAVICQAADGLCVAEKTGVVHRDIKPENMMFTSEGQLKIADFGIAHIAEQNLTQTGSILGSPNFMSPEQIDGRKPTHHTDLFSLGAVFYYCLTGQKPFSGSSIPAIMRGICDQPHVPVTQLVEGADPFLVGLVDTLLQKRPEDRGKGARWLSLQLRGYLNQKGILDLAEVSKGLLEKASAMGGGMTMVDTTPAPGPDEPPAAKRPLQAGMRAERPKPAGSGSGVRPGTWQASKGTAHGLKGGKAGSNHDFNSRPGSGSRHGAAAPASKALWIVGGILAAVLLLAAALVVVLGGKGKDGVATAAAEAGGAGKAPEAKQPEKIAVASVGLQPGSMELAVGQSRKFLVDVQPSGASQDVRWESSNPEVAGVQGGEVAGVKPGTATIRAVSAEDGSKAGSAEVTVTAAATAGTGMTGQGGNPGKNETQAGKGPADKAPAGKNPIGKQPDPGDAAGKEPPDDPAAKAPASKAMLTITSAPPFAEVIVDGRFLGSTPIKDKELAPGRHKIQVTHRSFPPIDTVVTLAPGEKTIRFRLFR